MKAAQAARRTPVAVPAAARMKIGLAQSRFAAAIGAPARTLQAWEQGRRTPSGTAQRLIGIAPRHPEIFIGETRR